MKRCFSCGGEATIFTGEKWLCEKCYRELIQKSGREQTPVGVKSLPQSDGSVDLQLSKL